MTGFELEETHLYEGLICDAFIKHLKSIKSKDLLFVKTLVDSCGELIKNEKFLSWLSKKLSFIDNTS